MPCPDVSFHVACQKPTNPRITCVDGFTISVQASAKYNCKPQTNSGPWTHFEVSCSPGEPLLEPFVTDPYWTPYVFDDVPINVVKAVIDNHGGILQGQLPQPLTLNQLCDLLVKTNEYLS